jgi:FtsH-binding integral membrane protein
MNLNFYKTCFKITAIGNIIAAILAIISMSNHLEMFYPETETSVLLRFYHYNLWAFVLMLGVGYWFLGKEPIRNRVVALIGAVGKLVIMGSWIHLLSANQAKPLILVAIAYDGFFGIVMAIFYWKTRNEKFDL